MKKIVALVLALAMTMSLSMVAFASEYEVEIVGDSSKSVAFDLVYTPGEDVYEDYVEVEVSWDSNTSGSFSYTKEAHSFIWNAETFEYEEDEVIPDSGELTGLPQLAVTVVNYSSPGNDYEVSFTVLADGISDMWDDESEVATPAAQAGLFYGLLGSGTGLESLADRTGSWEFDFSGLDNEKVMEKVREVLELDPEAEDVDFTFSTNVVIEEVLH